MPNLKAALGQTEAAKTPELEVLEVQPSADELIPKATGPNIPAGYVFVSIPEGDLYDYVHPTVQINQYKFEPGKTYAVPRELGEEVLMRLRLFEKESVRLLRPKADRKSLDQINKGSSWTIGGQRPTAVSLEKGFEGIVKPGERVITVK